MSNKIKAVIPAAGLGTRFLPLTKAQPKEMLPVVDKPTIQWVVEEAIDAGISDIGIIIGDNKKSIENHFSRNLQLEEHLALKNKIKELESIRDLASMANISYIVQDEQKGLGHAVYCARDFVGKSPFVVMLGDTICIGTPNCTLQLIELYMKEGLISFAVEKIELEDSERYGMVEGTMHKEKIMRVNNLVEKPKPKDSPSDLGIIGRYLFDTSIFDYLDNASPGQGGEIQLTDAMQKLSQEKELYALEFGGKRYDIGTMEDWFISHIRLSRDSFSKSFLEDLIK
tara:strand:+ start:675 stop:1526 length:852 start_codon:yes stop_codon:yes gene_type:complete